jgi:hypothetical protein
MNQASHRIKHQRTRTECNENTRRAHACLPTHAEHAPAKGNTSDRAAHQATTRMRGHQCSATEAHQDDANIQHTSEARGRVESTTQANRTSPECIDATRREAPPTPAERPPQPGAPNRNPPNEWEIASARAQPGAPRVAAQCESCPQGNHPILTTSAHRNTALDKSRQGTVLASLAPPRRNAHGRTETRHGPDA